MEIKNNIDINYLEEKMTQSLNLLEIAKAYCEYAYEEKGSVANLGSILEVILENQRELASKFDSMLTVG